MKTKRRRKFRLAGLPQAEIDLHRKLTRALKVADTADLFGEKPPEALLSPYDIDWDNPKVAHKLQRKYLDRASNISRCWNRLQLYLPELLSPGSARVLEMSTAHGAMLEILRHFGHEVLGNDYVNMVGGDKDPKSNALVRKLNDETFEAGADDHNVTGTDGADWPYQEIIEAINIPMSLFDAGKTPYPFEDDAFDVVICMQAIEHYCHPDHWMSVIEEFCRISTKTVLVLLNPMLPNLKADPQYEAAYEAFRRSMRKYDQDGFKCTSCHMHWGEALAFKLSASG